MAELFPPGIDEQIACAERELGYRRRLYPRWVDAGRMSKEKADREITLMEEIHATLCACKRRLAAR